MKGGPYKGASRFALASWFLIAASHCGQPSQGNEVSAASGSAASVIKPSGSTSAIQPMLAVRDPGWLFEEPRASPETSAIFGTWFIDCYSAGRVLVYHDAIKVSCRTLEFPQRRVWLWRYRVIDPGPRATTIRACEATEKGAVSTCAIFHLRWGVTSTGGRLLRSPELEKIVGVGVMTGWNSTLVDPDAYWSVPTTPVDNAPRLPRLDFAPLGPAPVEWREEHPCPADELPPLGVIGWFDYIRHGQAFECSSRDDLPPQLVGFWTSTTPMRQALQVYNDGFTLTTGKSFRAWRAKPVRGHLPDENGRLVPGFSETVRVWACPWPSTGSCEYIDFTISVPKDSEHAQITSERLFKGRRLTREWTEDFDMKLDWRPDHPLPPLEEGEVQ